MYVVNREPILSLATISARVIGIPLLVIRTRAANRSSKAAATQAKTTEEGHITDRITKAVEQLGSEKLSVRIGAIFSLERISKDSPRDYWPIMEILTAFVRENAPWPPRKADTHDTEGEITEAVESLGTPSSTREQDEKSLLPKNRFKPPTDIQAVLTVLGRRDKKVRKQDKIARRQLDLSETDLRGAQMWGAYFEHANFRRSHLENAKLARANLG